MSFTFKQFHVDDSHCSMKVGTDGVLLGAWADTNDVKSVLDIGAGSGIVSLFIAQKTEGLFQIMAVEVSPNAFNDCQLNFTNSPWSDILVALKGDFAKVEGVYDLIVSNPPFFSGSLNAPETERSLARQGTTLNYFSLIRYAAKHLSPNGRLVFISDTAREKDIEFELEINKLNLYRKTHVRKENGASPKRILWECGLTPAENYKSEILTIYEENEYHKDYVDLTKDFYLSIGDDKRTTMNKNRHKNEIHS